MEEGIGIQECNKICSTLVRIPDPVDCLSWVDDYIRRLPNTSVQTIDHPGKEPVLLARLGQNSNPEKTVLFCGHLDVLPPSASDEWKYEPHSGKVLQADETSVVYGRGSSDMKGGITSILKTMTDLSVEGADCSILCIFTTDEESGSYATRSAVKDVPQVAACFIPEPTSMRYYCIGEKGHMTAEVLSQQSLDLVREWFESNSAQPHLPEQLARTIEFSDKLFKSIGFTENMDRFHIRVSEDQKQAQFKLEIPFFVDYYDYLPLLNRITCPDVCAKLLEYVPPTLTNANSPVISALSLCCRKVTGYTPKPIFTYCSSDAPFFRILGIPTIVYGPGEIGLAHRTDEFVIGRNIVDCGNIFKEAAVMVSESQPHV